MAHAFRAGRKWMVTVAWQGALSGIAGCAGLPGGMPADSGTRTPAAVAVDSKPRAFSAPTAMDSLLSAHPLPLPGVLPASVPDSLKPPTTPKPADKNTPAGSFQIQVDALAAMDAAQTRKASLEAKLGVKMEMIFDAPYYKIRFGNFATRAEAEDKLLELAQKNVPGFIVRQ